MKTVEIILQITYDENGSDPPKYWSWRNLLDIDEKAGESVKVLNVIELETEEDTSAWEIS